MYISITQQITKVVRENQGTNKSGTEEKSNNWEPPPLKLIDMDGAAGSLSTGDTQVKIPGRKNLGVISRQQRQTIWGKIRTIMNGSPNDNEWG